MIFIIDVDDATMVRVDLERKIETLHEELDYTRKVRMEEVEDLKQQIQGQFKNLKNVQEKITFKLKQFLPTNEG